jgi:hypothetical protein
MSSSQKDYISSLAAICEFLVEDRTKAQYVLDYFYKQESLDMEEMVRAEGSIADAQKFELRMLSKKEQTDTISKELSIFKNDKFRMKASEFIQWIVYQMDPPSMFNYHTPTDLKNYLSKIKRYEGDMFMMLDDLKRKFRHLSPNSMTPAK